MRLRLMKRFERGAYSEALMHSIIVFVFIVVIWLAGKDYPGFQQFFAEAIDLFVTIAIGLITLWISYRQMKISEDAKNLEIIRELNGKIANLRSAINFINTLKISMKLKSVIGGGRLPSEPTQYPIELLMQCSEYLEDSDVLDFQKRISSLLNTFIQINNNVDISEKIKDKEVIADKVLQKLKEKKQIFEDEREDLRR